MSVLTWDRACAQRSTKYLGWHKWKKATCERDIYKLLLSSKFYAMRLVVGETMVEICR